MTWRRVAVDGLHSCGSCGKAIGKGQLVATTRTGLTRCEPCGRQIEDPPAVIEEAAEETSVPRGVKHQASLGFASAGELAGRHLANHLRVRSER